MICLDPLSSTANLAEYIIFNPMFVRFATNPEIRQAFLVAIEKAISDVS